MEEIETGAGSGILEQERRRKNWRVKSRGCRFTGSELVAYIKVLQRRNSYRSNKLKSRSQIMICDLKIDRNKPESSADLHRICV